MSEPSEPFVRYAQLNGRYRKLIAANFRDLPEARVVAFGRDLATDSLSVSDDEIEVLMAEGWRGRLTAAWLVGFSRRLQFAQGIRNLLQPVGEPYVGKGYCFALARFGGEEDALALEDYLGVYLCQPGMSTDCGWAMGALSVIDAKRGSVHSRPLLESGGPWEQWMAGKKILDPGFLDRMRDLIYWLSDFADECLLGVGS
ncbi:DUF6000 family protein [Streptacidiphilus sp. N1-10]|uniref:DUF6000 family protein n=1 Tax=Streptacidiphilus jeojiensis TaxID=3229225 RepID=A0ABV6XJD3_9ACTN